MELACVPLAELMYSVNSASLVRRYWFQNEETVR